MAKGRASLPSRGFLQFRPTAHTGRSWEGVQDPVYTCARGADRAGCANSLTQGPQPAFKWIFTCQVKNLPHFSVQSLGCFALEHRSGICSISKLLQDSRRDHIAPHILSRQRDSLWSPKGHQPQPTLGEGPRLCCALTPLS